MAAEPLDVHEDVISPELVLVSSPEVARRARERLPAEPWWKAKAVEAPPAPEVVAPAPPPPRRRSRSLVLAASLLAVVAVAGYLAESLSPGGASDQTVGPAAIAGFVPARAWSWVAEPGASAYDVTFYRDGRIVLHARTKQNRLVLPRVFRFEAGRYRWTVEPVPSVQGAAPIADSTFVLSTATADAANSS